MSSQSRAWRSDLGVALVGLLLLVAWEASGADMVVTRWFGSPEGFALRDHVFSQRVMHDGGRLLAWAVLALLVWDCWRPILPGPSRRMRAFGIGVVLALILAVPALKWASATSCPWDLAEFDGVAAYVPHWQLGVTDGGPGRCFPAGHAVAAFAYLGLFFQWRPHHGRLARALLWGVVLLGLAFGSAQLVRGAHFVSHTAWSAWLCWCGAALAHGLAQAWATRRVSAASSPTAPAAPDTAAPNAPRSGSPGSRPRQPARQER